MRFLTLSEKQIKDINIYNSKNISEKHVVISIVSAESKETILPNNINRLDCLHLKFDDVSDLTEEYIYFDQSMARDIIQFLESYCNRVSLFIVQCEAGLSRSVAVASALSKIINYTDDNIFTKGIPNMFVYTTILECFFGNRFWRTEYSKITQHHDKAKLKYLSPATVRLSSSKEMLRARI